MRSEWKICTLKDAGVSLIDCDHKTPKAQETGLPYIGIPQIKEGHIVSESARLISEEDFHHWRRKAKPTENDIILSRRCNPGVTAYVPNGLEIALGQNLVILRANGKMMHPEFLRWVVRGPKWWGQVNKYLNVGAVFESLRCAHIPSFEISLPPLPTQKKIAHILSTLDDKIELNRKMNETLEAMAQALFKSWFVDFDPVHAKAEAKSEQELEVAAAKLGISKEILDLFPSEFEESEMGMIPLGWEVKAIKDFGQVITGKTPSTKKKENYGVKYPFITIPDMHNQTFIVNTARYLSEEGHCVQSNKLIPKNSLMVSCIATVGLVSISSEDSHTNQQINSIICSENNLYFLYCMLSSMTDKLIMYGGAGTATLNVNKNTFENIRVIKPVEILLGKFLELVKPIFEQILANTKETQTLQKTRDTLLPKLLSGDLDVSNLDSLVE